MQLLSYKGENDNEKSFEKCIRRCFMKLGKSQDVIFMLHCPLLQILNLGRQYMPEGVFTGRFLFASGASKE